MVKTAWEQRVAWLLSPALHPTTFAYSFKPTDSAMYGGQPRIDFHAADIAGRFWGVEVKSIAGTRKSFNLDSEISAGQVAALNDIKHSLMGMPLLAIGQGKVLYVFNWRDIYSLVGSTTPLIPLSVSTLKLEWWGPKLWKACDLYAAVKERGWLSTLPLSLSAGGVAGSLPPSSISTPPPGAKYYPAALKIPELTESQKKLMEEMYQRGFQTYSPLSPTPPTPPISGPSWIPTQDDPLPLTSKPKASTRTRRRKLLSGL